MAECLVCVTMVGYGRLWSIYTMVAAHLGHSYKAWDTTDQTLLLIFLCMKNIWIKENYLIGVN